MKYKSILIMNQNIYINKKHKNHRRNAINISAFPSFPCDIRYISKFKGEKINGYVCQHHIINCLPTKKVSLKTFKLCKTKKCYAPISCVLYSAENMQHVKKMLSLGVELH